MSVLQMGNVAIFYPCPSGRRGGILPCPPLTSGRQGYSSGDDPAQKLPGTLPMTN